MKLFAWWDLAQILCASCHTRVLSIELLQYRGPTRYMGDCMGQSAGQTQLRRPSPCRAGSSIIVLQICHFSRRRCTFVQVMSLWGWLKSESVPSDRYSFGSNLELKYEAVGIMGSCSYFVSITGHPSTFDWATPISRPNPLYGSLHGSKCRTKSTSAPQPPEGWI